MAMKYHDLDWFEIWLSGDRWSVYSPTAKIGEFNAERRALEFVAAQPDPKTGDRGPIRRARHIAKCILKDRYGAPVVS